MNLTMNTTQHINITLSLRTESTQGKLLRIIYSNDKIHPITIQIIDGYINIELNERTRLQLTQILINDGQWHDIYFSIDYSSYYLLRLDHVFSDKISLSQKIYSNNLTQLIIGSDFDGCLGNFTLNNQMIHFQQEKQNESIEFTGTNNGCQSAEIIREYSDNDDLCSLYHPCYHGGICINYASTFICNCSTARFTGRQCQLDTRPCESYPCLFDEQCIPFSSDFNKSYTCIPSFVSLSISIKRFIYIGLIILFIICILLLLVIYCRKKRKENFDQNKSLISSPLLVRKSSLTLNHTESPIPTLVKLNCNRKQTTKTMTLVDNNHSISVMTNFNDKVRSILLL